MNRYRIAKFEGYYYVQKWFPRSCLWGLFYEAGWWTLCWAHRPDWYSWEGSDLVGDRVYRATDRKEAEAKMHEIRMYEAGAEEVE